MTYSGPTDLYIAGTWRPAAAGARFTVTDPATGAAIADVADADVTDARAATDAAEKALPDWAPGPPPSCSWRAATTRSSSRPASHPAPP
jgi:succinate-semialdehyde dehydrogenase / glutarate-semialdehyde dehydrogenase